MIKTENFEKIEVESVKDFHKWLEKNHTSEVSFWLVTYKKSTPDKYVSREEVLDELIAFGWIDGIRRKLDDDRTMQLISKRKVQHWAKSYKDRAERLRADDRMMPSGEACIKKSKENGMWSFMDDVDALIIPEDLKNALEQKAAFEFFDGINPSSKRFALRWLKLSKTEKTRNNRIQKLVSLSVNGEKLAGS